MSKGKLIAQGATTIAGEIDGRAIIISASIQKISYEPLNVQN